MRFLLALLIASTCHASASRDFTAATNRLRSSTVPTEVEDFAISMSGWMDTDSGSARAIGAICVAGAINHQSWTQQNGGSAEASTRTSSDATASCSGCTVSAGTWHHYGGVFAANADRRIFLDGGFKGTNTTNKNMTGTRDQVSIGSRCNGGDGAASEADGRIGVLGFWGSTLSDEFIQELSSGIAPVFVDPSNLRGFYALLETGNAQTAVDWSQELNDLSTVTGTDGHSDGPPWWWAGMTN